MEIEKPKRKQVRHKDVVDYWDGKISELELNVDFSEALEYCWACGYKRKLQGAHIIPHCLGGESVASNMVLLCKKCNKNNPQCKSVEDFWKWIKSRREINKFGIYPYLIYFSIYLHLNELIVNTKFKFRHIPPLFLCR